MFSKRSLLLAGIAGVLASSVAAASEKKYGPGVTDTEIRLGQTMPYSGPASAYGIQGKAQELVLTRSTQRAASTAARSS